jgi:hypothetical protein
MPGTIRKLQVGKETTAGVEVNATHIWYGTGMPDDRSEAIFPEENVGYISGSDRSYIPKLDCGFVFDQTECTFEQSPIIFSAAIKNVVTGAADTGGSGKIYTYTATTTQQQLPRTWTLEGGDDQQEEQVLHGFVEDFSLSGAAEEAVKISANWRGKTLSPSSFTTGLTLQPVEEVLFGKGRLYIDDADGTIGTSVKSNTFLNFDLSWKTGYKAVWTADGSLDFSFMKQVKPEIEMRVTFEHDGTAVAEKAKKVASVSRLIRVKFEGSALTTAGGYTYKTLIIDLAGKWQRFEMIENRDGNDVVTGIFRAGYNATSGLYARVIVVNEVASV